MDNIGSTAVCPEYEGTHNSKLVYKERNGQPYYATCSILLVGASLSEPQLGGLSQKKGLFPSILASALKTLRTSVRESLQMHLNFKSSKKPSCF